MVMALEVARQRGAFLRGVETSPAPWLQADGRCVGSGSGKITAATRGVRGVKTPASILRYHPLCVAVWVL